MVIDPQRRIAWGSHGWDGSVAEMKIEPENGVQYQLIKYKPDWARWDRRAMVEKACWRYRLFADDAKTTRGRLGTDALGADPCAATQCLNAMGKPP